MADEPLVTQDDAAAATKVAGPERAETPDAVDWQRYRSNDAPRPAAPRPDGGAAAPSARARASTRIRRADLILVANQMAVMLDTGVPIADTLRSIGRRASEPGLAAVLQGVIQDVEAGESFSRALGKYPRAFPPAMVALLRASEASGTMASMLNRVADYLGREHQIVKQVRRALMYPIFMFVICISITVFLLTFIMPRFVSIYEGRNANLPVLTKSLMAMSDGLVSHWSIVLASTLALVVGMLLWRRTAAGRRQFDWLKLNVPLFSGLFGQFYLSRACRTLGTMIETGVPLLEGVDIVRDVTRNSYYETLWDQVDENLRHGQPLSDALYDSPLIPEHVAQMIESGERVGRMGDVLSRVADFCESDFDQTVKTMTGFIEPVMIIVMGGIIGTVAVALLVPIFSVGRVVSGAG